MRHKSSRTSRAKAAGGSLVPTPALALGLLWSLLLGAVYSAPSRAALGDTVASVTSDSQQLKASVHVSTRTAYTVHELQTPTGTVIREFVAPSGVVFAVSWQGPFKPNMPLLLGRYFDSYANAQRSPNSTRSRAVIEQPDLVVHAGGHMRSFAGIAYVPQLLPANVVEGDLQ